jgi:hypothetical protein
MNLLVSFWDYFWCRLSVTDVRELTFVSSKGFLFCNFSLQPVVTKLLEVPVEFIKIENVKMIYI